MADLKEIGKRIQNRRKQQGYTQEQLAEMMNVSIQMISNLERGNKSIRIDNLINLCHILQVSTDYILTGKESAKNLSNLSQRMSQLSEKDQKMITMLIEYCLADAV
ncbi:MAG: helix-turn-helix transcriptional regulator [Oscillospiraceae bacterium]|nr:helix-turn-helix transcriptional regulator [Oscillospiraceae bacterium]